MAVFGLLHRHGGHRARQLRWVLPIVTLLFVAALAMLAVQYRVSDEAVSTEFFRAHKTIHHTGELLARGIFFGAAVLTVGVLVTALWALHVTHRIVRPVHTLHVALEALAEGELGVRVELHRRDEFQDVGAALNRLVERFGATLGTVHGLVDRLEATAGEAARRAHDDAAATDLHALARELDRTMEFFRLEPRRIVREDEA
jgi:methyl-accepting chemotaxis protein